MLILASSDVMISVLDNIDKKILSALRKKNGQDFASLQRKTNIGSNKTIEKHVKHLVKIGLIKDEKTSKGIRKFHYVILTAKGRKRK